MCILLVEDDAVLRMLMSEVLRDAGHDVVEAATGDEAIALILDPLAIYDALITDYHMPGRANGGDVAEHVRVRWPQVPIVIATGRPDVFQSNWIDAFGYICLEKPFLLSDLPLIIETRLSKKSVI